jgi:uncharacterized membrane protein YidH (DUF202 family)
MTLATVIDTSALGKVIVASLAATTAVALAYSIAILGATRFADMRRAGRPVEAGAFAVLGIAAFAVCVAAVVLAIVVMASK